MTSLLRTILIRAIISSRSDSFRGMVREFTKTAFQHEPWRLTDLDLTAIQVTSIREGSPLLLKRSRAALRSLLLQVLQMDKDLLSWLI